MQKLILLFPLLLCGCEGGPPHTYYNPAVVGGPRFKGPVTMVLVGDVATEKDKCIREGYTVIGTADYGGDQPEAKELKAQARRVHANHVVYSVKGTTEGGWHFRFGGGFGGGGTGSGYNQVHIVFLGK